MGESNGGDSSSLSLSKELIASLENAFSLCVDVETRFEGLAEILRLCKVQENVSTVVWYTPGFVVMLLTDLFEYQAALGSALFPSVAAQAARVIQVIGNFFAHTETAALARVAALPAYLVPFLETQGAGAIAGVRFAAVAAFADLASHDDEDLRAYTRRVAGRALLDRVASPALLEAALAVRVVSRLASGGKTWIGSSACPIRDVVHAFCALLQHIGTAAAARGPGSSGAFGPGAPTDAAVTWLPGQPAATSEAVLLPTPSEVAAGRRLAAAGAARAALPALFSVIHGLPKDALRLVAREGTLRATLCGSVGSAVAAAAGENGQELADALISAVSGP